MFPVWTFVQSRTLGPVVARADSRGPVTGIRSPDRTARNESLD
jgi:hypothetical protein